MSTSGGFVILFEILCLSVFGFEQEVVPHCGPDVEICEFEWKVDYLETMVVYDEGGRGAPVVHRNDSLYKRTGCNTFETMTKEEMDNTVMADGNYKIVYAINGKVPGPSVVVYEGQQVVVHLTNNLMYEGITIHWHGMVQWLTPWMDGVGTVSQCPINPGETFTYRWTADPPGTHWYHSHLGVERTDGLAGALIVLPIPEETPRLKEYTFDKDYVLFLHDWFPFNSIEIDRELTWGLTSYSFGLNESECYTGTSSTDGGGVGFTPFESGLINGKGHTFHNSIDGDIRELPLEHFLVKKSSYYRFRVINAGMLFAFRLSFDQHDVQLIAVDGNDIDTVGAESVIIHAGERADIVLYAGAIKKNYWIRGETLEDNINGQRVNPGRAFAVLQYDETDDNLPNTERVSCTQDDPCRIINCPFGEYPESYNLECVPISQLESTKEQIAANPVPSADPSDNFQELFLNFHFSSGADVPFTASVNGHKYIPYVAPPQIYPTGNDTNADCADQDCSDNCHCSYTVNLELGKTVQIVLLNQDDAAFGMAHPVHMHGHHFHVLKTVYPTYDPVTGNIESPNDDILCNTQSCNDPRWRNSSWTNGNVPGINLKNPPMKDTIIVPRQGYVVVRIKADNPGFWFMHCHIEMHQIAGMALLLQEGDIRNMPPTPLGLPTCGNFNFTEEEFGNIVARRKKETRLKSKYIRDGEFHHHSYWFRHGHWRSYIRHRGFYIAAICVLVITNIITLCTICMLKKRLSKQKESLSNKRMDVNKKLVFNSSAANSLFKSKSQSESKQNLIS